MPEYVPADTAFPCGEKIQFQQAINPVNAFFRRKNTLPICTKFNVEIDEKIKPLIGDEKYLPQLDDKSKEHAIIIEIPDFNQLAPLMQEVGKAVFNIQQQDTALISKAFSKDSFEEFAKAVSLYQILLLKNGFLCRGGIALNKHYSKSGFIFSPALIEAYKVESEKAIYPRIVISEDLIDFLYPSKVMPNILCKEYDGLYFINYITNELDEETHQVLLSLIDNCITNKNPSIAQKGLWLAGYSDVVYQTQSCPSRFTLFND